MSFKKNILPFIALSSILFTACNTEITPDWEDTLPTAFTTSGTAGVIYIDDPFAQLEPFEFPTIPTETVTLEPEPEYGGDEWVMPAEVFTEAPPLFTDFDTVTSPDFVFTEPPYVSEYYHNLTATDIYEHTENTDNTENTDITEVTVIAGDVQDTQSVQDTQNPGVTVQALSARPFSYYKLNTHRRYIYDSILEAAAQMRDTVTLSNVSDSDYKAVYELLSTEENAIFHLGRRISYFNNEDGSKTFQLQYIYTREQVAEMTGEIEAAADRILKNVTQGMSDYDAVSYLFGELAMNTAYDAQDPNRSDIYGALVNKKAACAGISKAFDYLCRRAGVESLLITGDFDIPHMWNMVKLGTEWYHADVTSGIASNANIRYTRYDYFLVTDEFIKRSRTVYPQDYSYPAAASVTHNYFRRNGLFANSYSEVERIIAQSVTEASRNRESVIQFAVSGETLFDETVRKLFEGHEVLNILDNAYPGAVNKFNRQTVIYNQDRMTLVIKLFLEYL